MDLSELRGQIDSIDDQIVKLFAQRMDVAARIGDFKKAQNLPVFVPAREREKLQDVAEKAGPEMANYTRVLYSMLFELSRSYQSKRNDTVSPLYSEITKAIETTQKMLATSVQDQGNNYTRSICISKNLEIYPGSEKTSIMMVLNHNPGALYRLLARLYMLGINVTKLESRPLPERDFEFMLYFDLDTSIYSEAFIQLMCELADLAEEFKYPGSYSEVV